MWDLMASPSKADKELMAQLKATEPWTAYTDRTPDGEQCRIKILGRGEMAFFQQGARALLLEVLAGQGVIFAPSIRRWDDGKKVTDQEREVVLDTMTRVMEKLGATEVRVVRR